MDFETKKNIQAMIDESLLYATKLSKNKYGDTPTDSLQLTPKGYVDAKIFWGTVASDGTAGTLPSGWTSVRNSVGNYTVTHNLGVANGVVVTSKLDIVMAVMNTMGINSFNVIFYNTAPTQTDTAFVFLLTK